eukprot:c5736_g1_i1.p1 GENE.c5736_g1_i1~~c5736_g1_i1.p1  ORF type:complete len:353 (-),score=60.23 c5736_g1_i1:195-1157(-)
MATRSNGNVAKYMNQAADLVKGLTKKNDDTTRRSAIRKIFLFVHFYEDDSLAKSVACVNCGAIQALLGVVLDSSSQFDTKASALRTLGQMSCFNEQISTKAAACVEFVQVIKPVFDTPIPPLWADTCYLINVIAADSWASHSILRQFVPDCTRLIESHDSLVTKETRANCIRFLGQLASNPANSDFLLEPQFKVLPLLVDAMRSLCVDRACTSAAVAVANLAGHNSQYLDANQTRELMKILVNALSRTLRGQDFPVGSNIFYDDWKLMVGVSKLLVNEENRTLLRSEGIVPLITISLSKSNPHPKLTHHALLALWLLTSP